MCPAKYFLILLGDRLLRTAWPKRKHVEVNPSDYSPQVGLISHRSARGPSVAVQNQDAEFGIGGELRDADGLAPQ
jgi:hypothetical protein